MMRALVLALALALLAASPVAAMESAPVTTLRDTASLITDTDAAAGPFHVALRLRMAPGWHTYYRNPGDAGLPPEVTVSGPFTAGPIAWPAPKRVSEGPITTFAYTGELVLPMLVSPGDGAGPLQVHASWLICRNICVPEEADFRLDLPAGPALVSAEATLFPAGPVASPYMARIAPDGVLSVTGAGLGAAVRQAAFYADEPGVIDAGTEPVLSRDGDTIRLALKPARGFTPGGLPGLLVLTDANGAETALTVAATPGPAGAAPLGLAAMLGLALLGGLILNLMPCVFPVLAMKAVGLARMSGAARGTVRAHAASYTAGVVLAFVALGGALAAARAAGSMAGWGFQFQSPVFVAGTAWLLFGVGLNLSGVYGFGGGLAGSGQSLAGRGGHWGSFFTGLLAVVVATPCTAPFMGAAMAGAFAAPAAVTVLVFAVMGFGLALPYALFAIVPGLARALPRPGAWMDVLKQALAFPMYGAAVWLVWVVSQQAGPDGVLAVTAGLLALGFAGWAWGRAQPTRSRLGRVAAVAGVIAAVALLPGLAAPPPASTATAAEGVEPFTPARLAELRRDGKPVFVNMTAAWCVSCLVNERVALSAAPVQEAFRANGVTYLRGDWTRQDPAISAFLSEHGRDGVPLYVYYPPGSDGVVLPQILTQRIVLDQIGASGRS